MLRWLSLRIFISLIMLPLAAVFTLFIIHNFIMQGVYFQDVPIVIFLWVLLLAISHIFLTTIGKKRFQLLLETGWRALKTNQGRLINDVFLQIDSLLNGGLLTQAVSKKLRESLYRRYFEYYRENVDDKNFRNGLVECLRLGIHGEEAYHTLKTYLLQKPVLTMPLVDLAETLLEMKPHDQNVAGFMVEKYLADKQKHFRAEYFYSAELDQGGRFAPEIVKLCFPSVKNSGRQDDFACHVYLHSIADNPELLDKFGHILFKAHNSCQLAGREDNLSKKLAKAVGLIPEEQIENWNLQESIAAHNRLSARLSRLNYHIQQKFIWLWGEILREKQRVLIGLGSVTAILLILIFVPFAEIFKSRPAEIEKAPVSITPVNTRFSLQVSASKTRSGAVNELNRLKRKKVDAFLIQPSRKGGWYKIYVGKYATQAEAKQKGQSLRSEKTIRDFFVVNYKGDSQK
ncbi:MAG: SPOR domain-containing protein [Calditrichaeota bacterium]|nr:MAG: SPOR domain-containing protein [Calditrichota bacterium]